MARASIILGLLACTSGVAAAAQPAAEWATFTGPPKYVERLQYLSEDQCLPAAESVKVVLPATARVAYVDWRKERPYCESVGGVVSDAVMGLALLDKTAPGEIVEFYRTHLLKRGYVERHSCERDGKEVIFTKSLAIHEDWECHLYSASHVIVAPAGELWRTSGYRTSIDIYQHVP